VFLLVPLAAAALLLASCSQHASKHEPEPPETGVPSHPVTLKVRSAYNLGPILVNERGRTLYLYPGDTKNHSRCLHACAAAWPPLLTDGKPKADKGTQASLVGTTKRPDGTTQVTYAGHPLYRYHDDLVPGQGRGVGMKAFGSVWYALTPKGQALSLNGPLDERSY
jgi:predicted lipoprotein with Yx(FWY)xxD motif